MSYPRVYASMIIKKVEEKDNDAKTASQHGSRESDIFLVENEEEIKAINVTGEYFLLPCDNDRVILYHPSSRSCFLINPEACQINWGRNQWFVTAGRDSLRHDFFHYFLYKTHTLKQPLNKAEVRLYEIIQNDR